MTLANGFQEAKFSSLNHAFMNAHFNDISLTGKPLKDRSYKIEGSPYFRIYLELSESAPDEWSILFDTHWRTEVFYNLKHNAGVEGDALWIECPPEEVKKIHIEHLSAAVAVTNDRHRAWHQEQARAEILQAEKERQNQQRLDDLGDDLKS
jgi:hypothetical protein